MRQVVFSKTVEIVVVSDKNLKFKWEGANSIQVKKGQETIFGKIVCKSEFAEVYITAQLYREQKPYKSLLYKEPYTLLYNNTVTIKGIIEEEGNYELKITVEVDE